MDNCEEAVILGQGGSRIGSLQGKVTTIGPWEVFKKYVNIRGNNIFGQDDLASFQVSLETTRSKRDSAAALLGCWKGSLHDQRRHAGGRATSKAVDLERWTAILRCEHPV